MSVEIGSQVSIIGGLVSLGCILVALTTDHWLYTRDEVDHKWLDDVSNITWIAPTEVRVRSGLWQACTYLYNIDYERAGWSALN